MINKLSKDLLDFYLKNKDYYNPEIEFDVLADSYTRIIQISYYTASNSTPLSKVYITFTLKDGTSTAGIAVPDTIAKRNVFGEYVVFTKDELKSYDMLDYVIDPKANSATQQEVTDWIYD